MDDFERQLDEIKQQKDAEKIVSEKREAQERDELKQAQLMAEQNLVDTVQLEMESIGETLQLRGYTVKVKKSYYYPNTEDYVCSLELDGKSLDFAHRIGAQRVRVLLKGLHESEVEFEVRDRTGVSAYIKDWALGVVKGR